MPLFSIIVPTYNCGALLLEAMESVRSQPFEDYELIIVDDGSTDETPAILAREAASDRWAGRLHIFSQANAGPGAARNLALQHARGEYCVFLDGDDLLFSWSLSVIAETITWADRPSVIIGREVRFTTREEFAAVERETLNRVRWPDFYRLAKFGPTGTLVAKTGLIAAAGGFATGTFVGEDGDLMLRLGTAPNAVHITAPGTFGYRRRAGRLSNEAPLWSEGATTLIRRYDAGLYPGGEQRRAELRHLVASNAAWYTLHCMKSRAFWTGIKLYLKTLPWQARAGEFDYLVKTPFRLMLCFVGLWPLDLGLRRQKL